MDAENLLKEKEEDLKVVQKEFDGVMEERQVIYKILKIYEFLRSRVNIELKIFLNSENHISRILKIYNVQSFTFFLFFSTFFICFLYLLN